jgi:putative transposase
MNKAEQTRLISWRLRMLLEAEASTRHVARTCRRFGISRRTFYKWRKRYKELGQAGLCDRPRRPKRSP